MDVTEGHYTNEMLNTEEQRLPFLIYVEDKKTISERQNREVDISAWEWHEGRSDGKRRVNR